VVINNFSTFNNTNNRLSPQLIEHKKATTYEVRNPGLGLRQAPKRGGVEPVAVLSGFALVLSSFDLVSVGVRFLVFVSK